MKYKNEISKETISKKEATRRKKWKSCKSSEVGEVSCYECSEWNSTDKICAVSGNHKRGYDTCDIKQE